jgi:tetratricopeptide (TPR) repeat protein
MKKAILVFTTAVAIAFIVYLIAPFHPYSAILSSHNDTTLIKQYTDSAQKLLQTKPESAILLYKKAIKRLENLPPNSNINHLLATVYIDLSNVYISQSKYDEAKALRIKALKTSGINDKDIQARVFLQDGLTCYHQSKYEEALKLYEQANALALKVNNRKLLFKITSNIAVIYATQGKVKMAKDGFNKSLKIAKEMKDNALISDTYINLGMIYTDQMDYQSAKKCYLSSIDYYKKNKQDDGLIYCYQNLGTTYYMMEDYADAIDCYQKSLQLAIGLDNKIIIAKDYNNIGEVYMLIGDYVLADKAFIRSLKIKESIGEKESMANGYRSLGELHFTQKNFSKSIYYYQKALQIDIDLQLVKDMSKDYAGISVVYAEYKQLTKAILYCKKALILAEKSDYTFGVAEDTRTLGGFYFHQKNYSLAESYYLKAIAMKMKLIDQEGLASVYNQMAQLYTSKPVTDGTKKQNLQKALTYGLKAYDIAEKLKIQYLISDVSNELSEIYKKLNNYPKAFGFLEINKKSNDSIFNKSKTEALVFAEARWNNEKKQQQISSLEKINVAISAQKLAEAKHHKTILYGLILMVVLIAFAAVVYWLYTNKKEEIRHQQQLSRMSMLRLQNIRNRISPHFIFNVLNREISSEEDEEKHSEMIGLVKFLRRSLEITEQTSVSLAEELDFVQNYLKMEQPTLGSDFQTYWEIDERIETKQFRIPAMILQIPVENALKHALRQKEGEKNLMIALTLIEFGLLITIQDNGEGYYPDKLTNTKGTGTGLKVLYQTIQLLNSKNTRKIGFDISNLQGKTTTGTKVEITVPVDYDFDL